MTIQILEDRFEIESQLSCTDFSTVYLACDRRYPHRPSCLVTAIPYYQREIRHRLEREAQLLERLGKHPQIPRVLAYFHQAQPSQNQHHQALGTFYLVQDHILGHPLSEEIVPPKKLSESYVSKLIKDVLIALTFAHEQGLVHQNLHPQHLIREARDGQIFVTQFGAIAKIARSKIAADGSMSSSIPTALNPYSAPEQLRAAAGSASQSNLAGPEETPEETGDRPQSDLYALGLIAIEALTGQRHHNFSYEAQMGLRWRDQAQVSLPLGEFIDRLIRQDWRDRFPHAKAALSTFKEQDGRDSLGRLRHRIAKDSRLATVVAAPGVKNTANGAMLRTRGPFNTTGLSGYSLARPLNPSLVKLVIASAAVVLALGVGVKAYQWGEYRFSRLSEPWQSWKSWKAPSAAYPTAPAKSLTPLLKDGSILLQPAAATAFWQMVAAARADGVALYPLSGYAANGDYATGYAVDIGGEAVESDRQPQFSHSSAFQWLKRNAQDYGFEMSVSKDRLLGGLFDEPWHWRYVGDESSRKVFGF
jgi:serine/threonine protein kinase